MEMDVLAVLMVAFGLFAILMFILFYIYVKKYSNEKHLSEDYEDSSLDDFDLVNIVINGEERIFNANDYNLCENEKVHVKIDNDIYEGIVSKGNYIANGGEFKFLPEKLVLQEESESNKVDEDINKDYVEEKKEEMDDFIPKKKKTI